MQPGATGAAFAASCKTRWSTTTPVHRFSTLMADLGGIMRHICPPPNRAPTFDIATTPNATHSI